MKDHNHIAEDEGQWNEEAYHKMCMEYNDAENTRLQEIRYWLFSKCKNYLLKALIENVLVC